MRSRLSSPGFARQLQTDLQTLTCSRFRGGPSISERALALDRIAGSIFLVGAAGLAVWFAGQIVPPSVLRVPDVTLSAQAAPGAPNLDLQKLGAEAAAEPMGADDIRHLQSRLQRLGFDPGPIDGIVGRRTLDALNHYRASRHLSRAFEIDRLAAADLLN
jgi:hypothetical protein